MPGEGRQSSGEAGAEQRGRRRGSLLQATADSLDALNTRKLDVIEGLAYSGCSSAGTPPFRLRSRRLALFFLLLLSLAPSPLLYVSLLPRYSGMVKAVIQRVRNASVTGELSSTSSTSSAL